MIHIFHTSFIRTCLMIVKVSEKEKEKRNAWCKVHKSLRKRLEERWISMCWRAKQRCFLICPFTSHRWFNAYVNNLVIEHDRGRRAARVSRDRSVCDTFLIASQLSHPRPLFKKSDPYPPVSREAEVDFGSGNFRTTATGRKPLHILRHEDDYFARFHIGAFRV